MAPTYAPKAAKALAYVKQFYNDIDIFVEDTANHNMWLLLLREILGHAVKITSVNMLGGRSNVENACRLDQSNTGRKKLYIVDGDFDFLVGRPKIKIKYLYRLRAYCIENILISENALIQIGLESRPNLSEAQISSILDYTSLMDEIDRFIKPLFVSYAVCFQIAQHIGTVRYSISNLYRANPDGPTIDERKVFRRVFDVYRSAANHCGIDVVRSTKAQVLARSIALPPAQTVAGKDYVLPLVLSRFKARCGYSHASEQFKVALARSFSPSSEPYLARRLRNLMP